MAVIVPNEQPFPANLIDSNNASTGLFSFLLIGILPVLLAGLLSTPAYHATPPCPVITACPVTAPCPVTTPSPVTTQYSVTTSCPLTLPCPVTTPCPTPPQCEPISSCPNPFSQLSLRGGVIQDRCFFFTDEKANFPNAIAYCARAGGTLLNIKSVEEGQAIANYLNVFFPNEEFWVGYTDFIPDADVTGLFGGNIPLPYFGDIPDTTAEQDCLVIFTDGGNPGKRFSTCSSAKSVICDVDLGSQLCECRRDK